MKLKKDWSAKVARKWNKKVSGKSVRIEQKSELGEYVIVDVIPGDNWNAEELAQETSRIL